MAFPDPWDMTFKYIICTCDRYGDNRAAAFFCDLLKLPSWNSIRSAGSSLLFLVPSGKIHMEMPPFTFSIPVRIFLDLLLYCCGPKTGSSSAPSTGLTAEYRSSLFGNKTGRRRNCSVTHYNVKIASVVSNIKYCTVGRDMFQSPDLISDPCQVPYDPQNPPHQVKTFLCSCLWILFFPGSLNKTAPELKRSDTAPLLTPPKSNVSYFSPLSV